MVSFTKRGCSEFYINTSSNMESRGEHKGDTISHETDPYLRHIEYMYLKQMSQMGVENLIIHLQPSESFCCHQRESESTPKETGLSYHICSLIFLPSNSIVLILKSIPGQGHMSHSDSASFFKKNIYNNNNNKVFGYGVTSLAGECIDECFLRGWQPECEVQRSCFIEK